MTDEIDAIDSTPATPTATINVSDDDLDILEVEEEAMGEGTHGVPEHDEREDPSPVRMSEVALTTDSGWETTQMTDDELAVLAHSDASIHALTRAPAPDGDAALADDDPWATTKIGPDQDILVALSNPALVRAHGETPEDLDDIEVDPMENLSTIKMTDYQARRVRERSMPLEQDRRALRARMTTPNDRPGHAPSASKEAPRATPGARSSGATISPWWALALIAALSLIALLAHTALR